MRSLPVVGAAWSRRTPFRTGKVIVWAALTVWAAVPELPLNVALAGNDAVRVFAPVVVEVREHEYVTVAAAPPVGVASVHESVPSDTVTVPVIAVEPLARVTLTSTV